MHRRGPLVRFLGTGTPIGQRGLHQACILVETSDHKLLIDCGMTALTSLGRIGLEPADIDADPQAQGIERIEGQRQHSLSPTKALRYSITFRTLKRGQRRSLLLDRPEKA